MCLYIKAYRQMAIYFKIVIRMGERVRQEGSSSLQVKSTTFSASAESLQKTSARLGSQLIR